MSTVSSSFQPLHTLVSLINTSLSTLESTCTRLNTPWPSLNTPLYPSVDHNSDAERVKNKVVAQTSATIIAAAMQLVSTIADPGYTVIRTGLGFQLSSALRTVTELHVVDILRNAGKEGIHVDEIANTVKVDSNKLARILRLLATHHIFTETRPNVFANNRVSAVLEKGQDVDVLIKNPSRKYDNSESALAALLCHLGDEVFKSSAHLFETLAGPQTAFSGSPSKSAWVLSRDLVFDLESPAHLAMSTPPAPTPPLKPLSTVEVEPDLSGVTVWDLLAHPSPPVTYLGFKEERLRRFGVAMEAVGRINPMEEVLSGFDFASLPQSSVIVDVGGGVGAMAELLTTKYKNVNVLVQDREEVIQEGIKRWKETNPRLLENEKVAFQAHSFFSPQPPLAGGIKPAAFLLKAILHDWSDEYCHIMLKHLRNAVAVDDSTRLLVVNPITPSACSGVAEEGFEDEEEALTKREFGNVYQERAKAPLLGNWGAAGATPYFADMIMLLLMNGQERTLSHIRMLFRKAGWEIVKVTLNPNKTIGQVLALIESKPMAV